MAAHVLDNPVWHSLTTQHAVRAHRRRRRALSGRARPSPPSVNRRRAQRTSSRASWTMPRIRVRRRRRAGTAARLAARAEEAGAADGLQCARGGGSRPARHGDDGWACARHGRPDGPGVSRLLPRAHAGDGPLLRHLPRVAARGDGRGADARLDGYQELSAVCTHPDYTGRGYAQRLLGLLCNSAFDRGFTPFLHVYSDNTRAIGVYRRMSFVDRTVLPFWALHQ